MKTLVLCACGVAAAVAPLGAQQRPRSDSLPRELVQALLGGSLGSRQVDVQAGLADDSLPSDLFRDALLLGFADYRTSRTTVAYFPYAPQPTIDTIKARLVAAGWTAPPQREDSARGFVSTFGGSFPQVICREGAVVIPTVVIRSTNSTLAVISKQRSQGANSLCSNDPMRTFERMRPGQNTPLPALPAPAGMRSSGSGSSGVPDQDRAMTMSTSLEGSAALPDILAHYEKLFIAAGWRKAEQVVAGSIGVMTFEVTSKGAPWHCAFVVSIPGADAADVHLTLRMR